MTAIVPSPYPFRTLCDDSTNFHARLEVRSYKNGTVQLNSAGPDREDRFGKFHFPMTAEFAMALGKTLIYAAQTNAADESKALEISQGLM